jgi:hypothetical protein
MAPSNEFRSVSAKSGSSPNRVNQFLIPDLTVDQRWVVRPDWVKREGIRSFAGNPLNFRKEVPGRSAC